MKSVIYLNLILKGLKMYWLKPFGNNKFLSKSAAPCTRKCSNYSTSWSQEKQSLAKTPPITQNDSIFTSRPSLKHYLTFHSLKGHKKPWMLLYETCKIPVISESVSFCFPKATCLSTSNKRMTFPQLFFPGFIILPSCLLPFWVMWSSLSRNRHHQTSRPQIAESVPGFTLRPVFNSRLTAFVN